MKFKAQHYLRFIQLSQITKVSTLKQVQKKEVLGMLTNPEKLSTSMKSSMTPKVKENGPFLTNMQWK